MKLIVHVFICLTSVLGLERSLGYADVSVVAVRTFPQRWK